MELKREKQKSIIKRERPFSRQLNFMTFENKFKNIVKIMTLSPERVRESPSSIIRTVYFFEFHMLNYKRTGLGTTTTER